MAYVSTYTGAQSDTYITKTQLVNLLYPVGSIYISLNSTSPETLFGGTWQALQGRFLIGCDTGAFAAGVTGGADESALTATAIPSHTHEVVDYSASGSIDNPCFVVLQSDGNLVNYIGTPTSATGVVWNSGTSGASTGSYRSIYIGGPDKYLPAAGGGATTYHNNIPPFIWVNMWKRTA